jgi:tripartite-type tricarboxylate transporter receptor subunit TctC
MLRRTLCALSLAAGLAAPAVAQDYPTRPIELIVAFAAGGTTDIGARVVASIAEQELGQPIVVLNKGGAGGQLGWTELATSRPNGYTIGYVNLPNLSSILADPERQAAFTGESFTPIVNHIVDPGVIWVRADSPYQSLDDVLAAAKANPNTVRAATTGILGDDHLAILRVQQAAEGAQFRVVHLQDSAAQLKEVLAGNVDVGFDNVGGLVKYAQSGDIRILAVMDEERSKFLPDVPTTTELGYPSVISSSSRGIVGPAGLDPAIVEKLESAFLKAMNDPEHIAKLEASGFTVRPMPADEFAAYFAKVNDETKALVDLARQQ